MVQADFRSREVGAARWIRRIGDASTVVCVSTGYTIVYNAYRKLVANAQYGIPFINQTSPDNLQWTAAIEGLLNPPAGDSTGTSTARSLIGEANANAFLTLMRAGISSADYKYAFTRIMIWLAFYWQPDAPNVPFGTNVPFDQIEMFPMADVVPLDVTAMNTPAWPPTPVINAQSTNPDCYDTNSTRLRTPGISPDALSPVLDDATLGGGGDSGGGGGGGSGGGGGGAGDISNFSSAVTKAAFWNVKETDQTYLLCEWQGYNLTSRFFSVLRTSAGAIVSSGQTQFDDLQSGITWRSLSLFSQLMQQVYRQYFSSNNDPMLVALDRVYAGSIPGASQAAFNAITIDDRRLVTALILWFSLYAPVNASSDAGSMARAQIYRLDQVVIPADCIPLPMPGGMAGLPANDAPVDAVCRRIALQTPSPTVPQGRTPPSQTITPTTPARSSSTGLIVGLTLVTLTIGGAIAYAVYQETH
jgi:hypothetical protein